MSAEIAALCRDDDDNAMDGAPSTGGGNSELGFGFSTQQAEEEVGVLCSGLFTAPSQPLKGKSPSACQSLNGENPLAYQPVKMKPPSVLQSHLN